MTEVPRVPRMPADDPLGAIAEAALHKDAALREVVAALEDVIRLLQRELAALERERGQVGQQGRPGS
jgi:hypothetical protein